MCAMTREISAGGVVLREIDSVWYVALIEPRKDEPRKDEPQKDEPGKTETEERGQDSAQTQPRPVVPAKGYW